MKGVKQRTGCYELGEERCRCAPREAAMGFGRDPALSGMAGLIATRPEPLGRKARINRFGVDCGEGLEWQAGWEPGGGGAGEGRGSEPEVCDATKPTRACRSVPNEVANETEISHAEQQQLGNSTRNCCTSKLAAGAAVGRRFHVP